MDQEQALRIFHTCNQVGVCSFAFVLHLLQYCSLIWLCLFIHIYCELPFQSGTGLISLDEFHSMVNRKQSNIAACEQEQEQQDEVLVVEKEAEQTVEEYSN